MQRHTQRPDVRARVDVLRALQLSWALGNNGGVLLQAEPLFLYGPNGLAWSLPLAVAVRWN